MKKKQVKYLAAIEFTYIDAHERDAKTEIKNLIENSIGSFCASFDKYKILSFKKVEN